MSEFSESYHLRSERAEDAVELLRRAGLKGYVFPPANGWVTFVAEGGIFEPDERVVAASTKPLLHFMSAEDHGWSFTLHDGARVASRYSCAWDDEIRVDDSLYSRADMLQLVPSVQPDLLDTFEASMLPDGFDDLLEAGPSRLLAQAMGLPRFEWLAFDYIDSDFQLAPNDHPDVTPVS